MRICIVDGCNRFGRTRSMCDMHYQREVRKGTYSSCSFDDCSAGIVSSGMCEKHYRRELRARKPENISCLIESCNSRPVGKGWCSKHYSLYTRYGIDPQRYEDILLSQGYVCVICGSDSKLHMDHDHETGEIRGVLCGSCNRGIGLLKDSFTVVSNAAEYLKKWRNDGD